MGHCLFRSFDGDWCCLFISHDAGAGSKLSRLEYHLKTYLLAYIEIMSEILKQILEGGDTKKPKHKTSLAELHLAVKPERPHGRKGSRGRRIVPPLFASICTPQEINSLEEIQSRLSSTERDPNCSQTVPSRSYIEHAVRNVHAPTTFFIDLTLSSSKGLTRARIFTDGMFHETQTPMHWLGHGTSHGLGPVTTCP